MLPSLACRRASTKRGQSSACPKGQLWRLWLPPPHHNNRPRHASGLTTSHTRGPTAPALLEQTIGQYFSSTVAKYGDRPAVIAHHQETTLSYDALDRASNALARGLQSLNVQKGDRVAVSLGNNVEHVTATFALAKLGAILVPLNPAFTVTQVAAAITHLEASHLIIGTETHLPFKDPRSNAPLLEHLVPNLRSSAKIESALLPSLKGVVVVDNSKGRVEIDDFRSLTRYQDVVSEGPSAERYLPDQGLHHDEIINIQFTSGTTSTPKAACLTHRNVLNNGKSIGDRLKLTAEDAVCCPPPLFHCFGCVLGLQATSTHGAAIVFPSECFDPLATLTAAAEYRCTALYGVPTMFLAELDLMETMPSARALAQMTQFRTGIAAGSAVPAELIRKLKSELYLDKLTNCYGMTETSPVSLMTAPSDTFAKRVNTVGKPLPHVSVKIVDPTDRTRVVPVGSKGEVVVSGYLTMRGYWNDAGRTAEALVPDDKDPSIVWMHTGDEGVMDADGYVAITGRIKDLIIRGGENISPLEVESCLLACDGVAEAAVVGLPDERYGECVAAFVVKREGTTLEAQDVREWVRGRLSAHLIPKFVFWTDPKSLPKTASGKVQKYKLKETGLDLLQQGKGLE
ncbi:acyl-CoA synthetases /AMP-acid ligases II [Phyllosticta capitalensis]